MATKLNVALCLLVGALILNESLKDAPEAVAAAPAVSESPEKVAARERVKDAYSSAQQLRRSVREGLKDPDSMKVAAVAWAPGTDAVCMNYRARNSFNAVVTGAAYLDRKKNVYALSESTSNFAAKWKKLCSGETIPFSM